MKGIMIRRLFSIQGRFTPDVRLERLVFVEACRLGDLATVKDKLMRGADPNYFDDTDCKACKVAFTGFYWG